MPAAKKAAIASPASTKIADETKTEPPAITAEPFAITATVKARQQRSKSKPSIVLYLEDWRNPMAYPPPECKDMAWLAWESCPKVEPSTGVPRESPFQREADL